MSIHFKEFISEYEIENPLNKIIYQIISLIKNFHDYDSAIQIIIDNNLTLEDIVTRTCRLNFSDVIMLADRLISLKE